MAKSMTGFGRAEVVEGDKKFTVELKSVNNRYLDLGIRMPRQFNPFESDIRAELKKYMERGKVDVFISYENRAEGKETVRYNRTIAEEYLGHIRAIADDFGLSAEISATRLSSFPDVLTTEEAPEDETDLWPALRSAIDEAAEMFRNARIREGAFLQNDLNNKLDGMMEHVEALTQRAPEIVREYQAQLTAKIRDLLQNTSIDENRILQEVAIYSDKVCIDEELVRLKSHIAATKEELEKESSVGRKLDFLAQEMNREANTILSKTIDVESSSHAIELKTEIEKIREQIQNIE